MSGKKLTSRDSFDYWVDYMNEAIAEFKEQLPSDVADALDWSPESLDVLEEWILQNYSSPQEMLSASTTIVDGAGRYVGETFRRALRDHYWDIDLDDEKNVFFGLPVLTTREKPTPLSPLSLVTTAADRRRGDYLSTLLANNIKRRQKRN
ncbi:MAG TPA: hypothetical protein VJT72_19545 [Pseudonocardiaceae bacterium]|nr:hypothetical protein [Pseudonocardiaceae bacterium]